MKEAKVRCVCAEIRLPDLDIKLREGQEVWLSPEKAKLSSDLDHARRIGAVQIIWKERARVTKAPAPPNFRRLSPGQRRKATPPKEPETKTVVVQQGVDQDALAKHVKAAVAGEVARQMESLAEGVGEQIDAIRGDLAKQVADAMAAKGQQIDQDALAATLAAVIKDNMPETVQGAPAPSRAAKTESEDPLYIPSGIVDKKTEGRVDVQESAGDVGGTDDAAAALKKLRKAKLRNKNDE